MERIKKTSRIAPEVKVYSFNSKADTWWELNRSSYSKLSASIYQFQWEQIEALANMAERTMELSITISDQSAYIATQQGECEVSLQQLQ